MAPMVDLLIARMASSLMQRGDFSLLGSILGKGVMRAGKGQEGRFLPLFALPSMMKIQRNESSIKIFSSAPSFNKY